MKLKINTSFFTAIILAIISMPGYANQQQFQLFLNASDQQTIITKYHLTAIKFMPGLYVGDLSIEQYQNLLKQFPGKITLAAPSHEELAVSAGSMLLKTPDNATPPISNWWDAGYTGKSAVIGVLDSGVPDTYTDKQGNVFKRQPGLENITMIVNRNPHSGFFNYLNGVRTPHGTGVAGVFAIAPTVYASQNYQGLSYGVQTILVTLAGDSTVDDTNWKLTLLNMDWLLSTPDQVKPNIINYSYGNGGIYCPQLSKECYNTTDWSAVAKTIDYVVNTYHVSWIKSAGNGGWINPTSTAPYASTASIPSDSYNAIVVANMNNTVSKTDTTVNKTSDRSQHFIRYSSSRGPTLLGRRKPDLTAPGTDIRTSTPDQAIYAVPTNPTFTPYSSSMQYDANTETRLVTGTSIATPHVGAAAAIIYDAGIHEPMMIKALLINSADTWTDNNQPGPGDPNFTCTSTLPNCGHGKIMGSQWNRTYGWGYINMDNAYKQRSFVHTETIVPHQTLCYQGYLTQGDKVTIVWERRVGTNKQNHWWQLTPLHLAMYNNQGNKLLSEDDSRIDNVLQVANYPSETQEVEIKINIPDDIQHIDGAHQETFALASSSQLTKIKCR